MAINPMMEDNFEGLFKVGEDVTAEKLVLQFYDKKNINMKTEIPDKMLMAMAVLKPTAKMMRKEGLTISADLTEEILEEVKELMVSRNREGRKEGTAMLGAIRQQLQKSGTLARILGVGE